MKKIISASFLAATLFTSNALAASANVDSQTGVTSVANANFELPSATIISPASGDTVGTDFTVSATITGDGITQVEVLVDNVSKGVKTVGPFDFAITGIADGSHSVIISATGPGVQLQSAVNVYVGTAATHRLIQTIQATAAATNLATYHLQHLLLLKLAIPSPAISRCRLTSAAELPNSNCWSMVSPKECSPLHHLISTSLASQMALML